MMKITTYRIKKSAPLRFHIEMHNVCEDYPNHVDLIFDLFSFAKRKRMKTLSFSRDTIFEIYGEKLKNSVFMGRVKSSIKSLIDSNMAFKNSEDEIELTEKAVLELFEKHEA